MKTRAAFRLSHRLLRLAFVPAACALLTVPALTAQTTALSAQPGAPAAATSPAGPPPSFEVATIKPGTDDERSMMMFNQDGVSIHNIPMQMILREAFNTEDDHIVGAPAWVKSTHYDIEAKVSAEDAPKLKGLKGPDRASMMVPLLVDRFGLKYHHETREMTVYNLVVAKGGLKMKESAPDPAPPKDANPPAPGEAPKPPQMKGHMLRMEGPGKLTSEGTGTDFLVHVLSQQLGKTVVNKTGLDGRYDYSLNWTPDNMPPPGPGGPENNGDASNAVGPSLFTALEEQLGLKLESTKAPVDVIVIDHIEAPSAN